MTVPSSNPHDDTKQQISELLELRDAHRARLRFLQIQSAKQGQDTPPHIQIEIGDLDTKITEINATVARLQQSLQATAESITIPEPKSLVPVSIVPETINERLIATMMTIENYQAEMRRGLQAIQLGHQHDTTRLTEQITATREALQHEHTERRGADEQVREDTEAWKRREMAERLRRQKNQSRWMWMMSFGLIIIFICLVIMAWILFVNIAAQGIVNG